MFLPEESHGQRSLVEDEFLPDVLGGDFLGLGISVLLRGHGFGTAAGAGRFDTDCVVFLWRAFDDRFGDDLDLRFRCKIPDWFRLGLDPRRGNIPGSEDTLEEGNGNPHQYSCLENPIDRGAWWATVHGVARNWT